MKTLIIIERFAFFLSFFLSLEEREQPPLSKTHVMILMSSSSSSSIVCNSRNSNATMYDCCSFEYYSYLVLFVHLARKEEDHQETLFSKSPP